MHLCQRAGRYVPLLSICAFWFGCATTTTDQPANFNGNPQVVAIYAVDSAFGALPDVLIYSTNPADAARISANPPPSYGSYRVEFDQPVSGQTVASQTDRADVPGDPVSFCSTTPQSPVQLVDVEAARNVVSSVCYDATSALGSHPHVLIIPGADALSSPTATPLTCNTFTPQDNSNGNVFTPNHQYGVQVKSGVIQGDSGKFLTSPTSGGWTNDVFQFKTSGLKILAAGTEDPDTGFLVWLDKPDLGFEKDLAPCATTKTCPPNNAAPTFLQPTDGTPFLIVLSEPVSDTSGITLTRSDGSNPAASIGTGGGLFGDPRVVEVSTGDTFEPGQTYILTVPASLTADSNDAILATGNAGSAPGIAAQYTISSALGSPGVVTTTPRNSQTAIAVLTAKATKADSLAVVPTTVSVQFTVPVDAAPDGTPTGTFKLSGPNGDVPLASVKANSAKNNQVVTLTPTAALAPETAYTVATSGTVVGPKPASLKGQPIPGTSATFTTATFRMNRISLAGSTTNLDRRATIEPANLKDGTLQVVFNTTTAAGVDSNSIVFSELDANNTATKIPGYTVAQVPPAANDLSAFTITLPPNYQSKFGQKYEVRTATTITDAASGKKLRAEGCNPASADCSDVKTFTTRTVGIASIDPDPSADAPTGFSVSFTDPMDPASIDLVNDFKLFPVTAAGIDPNPVQGLSCAITSTGTDPTVVTCTAPAGTLAAPAQNVPPKSFLASVVFLSSAPAKAVSTVSTDPSAQFAGNASATLFAPCP
jgi:hypothetical protein